MKKESKQSKGVLACLLFSLLAGFSSVSEAVIDGVTGTTFNLTAKQGYISTPDGNSILVWGYALDDGLMQYPGPTLIVNQGDSITVTLNNDLASPVSIQFPGQTGLTATGGSAGLLAQESTGPADTVSYSFVANNAGTFMYQSATQPELQVEMGLAGALIVRPPAANQAYNHADSAYDHEYLIFMSQMDPEVHFLVQTGRANQIDNSDYSPVYWFINGRNFPDIVTGPHNPLLPHQPYDSLPRVHPGEKALIRLLSFSRDLHPFHTHGNHFRLIARDGRLLESAPGAGADLSFENFTLGMVPGATYDALWSWTGEKLGWDIYGTALADNGIDLAHSCDGSTTHTGTSADFDSITHEYCPDHGVEIPVQLPALQEMAFGGFYSGSPYLGGEESLPPGEGGLNINGSLFHIWHSHAEKELVNFDVFPGGSMTMMIVEPPGVPIP